MWASGREGMPNPKPSKSDKEQRKLRRHAAIIELRDDIALAWPISQTAYPLLDGPKDHHALVHAVIHLSKSSGKVSGAVEPYVHGKEVDLDTLRDQLAYTLVNVLRIADLADIPTSDILDVINDYIKKSKKEAKAAYKAASSRRYDKT